MKRLIIYSVFLTASICFSCKSKNNDTRVNPANERETLLRVNKYLVKKDADAIKGFISRRGWNMTETQTGLWYEITVHGKGVKAETGKKITLSYKLWLLDGTLCYSSDVKGNKTFILGKGEVEPGLEQGIRLLNEGDKARFILPPHLAYGLIGDEDKIPARATLVYEVQLIKISDQ